MRIALPSPTTTWALCAGAMAALLGVLTYAAGPLWALGVAVAAALSAHRSWRSGWQDVRAEWNLCAAGIAHAPALWALEWSDDHWRLWRVAPNDEGCSAPVRLQLAFSCAAGVLLRLDCDATEPASAHAESGIAAGTRWWWLPLQEAGARGRRLRLLMACS